MPDETVPPTSAEEVIAEAVSHCRRDSIQDAEDYASRIMAALDDAGFTVRSPPLTPAQRRRLAAERKAVAARVKL